MRLLTEAAGQVLTRNVAADRCWILARDQQRRIMRTSKRGLSTRSMPMPMAIPAENQAESTWPSHPVALG